VAGRAVSRPTYFSTTQRSSLQSMACRLPSLRPAFHAMSYRFSIFLFAFVVATLTASAAEKRLITERDLFDFVWVGDAQVSPDGSRVAVVRVTVNENKEGYNTSIWLVPTADNDATHRSTT